MVQKTTLKPFFSFLVFCLCFVGLGFGQSIFENSITDTTPSSDNPYTNGQIINNNINVDGIKRGPGLTPPAPAASPEDRYSARSWSTNLAIDMNDYFEFTITPNSGYEIDFASFAYTGQASDTGPLNFAFRSSLDNYSANIGVPTVNGTTIDLAGGDYQNITTSVIFRFYAWGGSNGLGTFSINDFTFNGNVTAIPPCNGTTTTWIAGSWDNGTPNLSTPAIIAEDYNTAINGSLSACSLTVNSDIVLAINDEDNGSTTNDYVLIQNDIIINGAITMTPKASFVQLDDSGSVSGTGSAQVSKETAPMNAWYEYTYWSSPVSGAQIGTALTDSESNRRFLFKAQNFLDAYTEIANSNTWLPGNDNIDDNGNDWQRVNGSTVMMPGVGYAATHSEAAFIPPPFTPLPYRFKYTFEGLFNNGVISVAIYRNDFELNDRNWNLIGNPYPSAIDADLFLTANSDATGAIHLWSQNTAPSSTASGNQVLNFSGADYAVINGTGQTAGGDGLIPERKIPSGQAFFIAYDDSAIPISIAPNFEGHDIAEGEIVFNNSMRVIGASDNSQFFKGSNSKSKSTSIANKLWIDLKSDNGVFNQTLVGYVNGASNNDDGMYFDAPKSISTGNSAILYTNVEGSNKKFAIQGKAANSLDANEIINLGFSTNIKVATLYTLSIAQLEGDFLTNNTIYLKDNLLNKVHNLSDSDYTFTSGVGEFNDRFVVMFNNQSLSTDELLADVNSLKIIDVGSEQVQFMVSNDVMIKKVSIFDILGRQLYHFKGQSNSETYHLSNLKNNIYIAKVEFLNGAVITKKAVKK